MGYEHELIIPNEGFPFKLFRFEGKDGHYVREKHCHRLQGQVFCIIIPDISGNHGKPVQLPVMPDLLRKNLLFPVLCDQQINQHEKIALHLPLVSGLFYLNVPVHALHQLHNLLILPSRTVCKKNHSILSIIIPKYIHGNLQNNRMIWKG